MGDLVIARSISSGDSNAVTCPLAAPELLIAEHAHELGPIGGDPDDFDFAQGMAQKIDGDSR